MEKSKKEEFLSLSSAELAIIYDRIASSPPLRLSTLDPNDTALVIVDMVNGFARKGPLSSENALRLAPSIVKLLRVCAADGVPCVFFADTHGENSPEFGSYPPHCLKGTEECRPLKEFREIGGFVLIEKNSTNGFLEPEFSRWLERNSHISNFLVVGCCTDICVQQFALTLKTDFNRRDRNSRVIVPMDLCATYDAPGHQSELINLVSFYNMQTSGVEVTQKIEY